MQRPVSLKIPACQLPASGDRVCLLTWKTAMAPHTPVHTHIHTPHAHTQIKVQKLPTHTPTSAPTDVQPPCSELTAE